MGQGWVCKGHEDVRGEERRRGELEDFHGEITRKASE